MPTLLSDLSAWRQLAPPVRIGPARQGTITIGELATGRGYDLVTRAIAAPGLTRRSRQLTPLHLANWATIELLARPVFADGVWIAAAPRQLGFVIGEHGDMPELWLDPGASAGPCPEPSAIGAAVGALLGPVASVVSRCASIHERAVITIAAESAIAGFFRAARSAGHPDDAEWLDEASAAVADALGTQVSSKRMRCRPDGGAAVVLPARSLCCVLHAKTSCHSCPGCPKSGSASERERGVTEWLSSMPDDEFLEMAGRPKCGRLLSWQPDAER